MSEFDVVVRRGTDTRKVTREAVLGADILSYISKDKTVLLKPNLLNDTPHNKGITTNPDVTEEILSILLDSGYKVILGDGGSMPGEFIFPATGYDSLASRYGVELVDLNKGNFVTLGLEGLSVGVNSLAITCQVVSIAKLKVHSLAGVTLTMKNLFGCVVPKGHLHNGILRNINILHDFIKPVFGVIDATVANMIREDTQTVGDRLDAVIASSSCVAADYVGSRILRGSNIPEFLKISAEMFGQPVLVTDEETDRSMYECMKIIKEKYGT